MSTNIYFPPSLQRFEPKRMVFSTWVDHLPFAYDLVEAIRPKMTVELGVYNGLSFFTFCQSLIENDIEGEATCHYLIDLLEPYSVSVSRIGFGLPSGGSVLYADSVTLQSALAARQKF